MQLNIPILLTIFRVLLTPFLILFFYLPFHWTNVVCVIIFIIAILTDWFDGFLARLLDQTTKFGAFLDPVADKLIVITTSILIIQYYNIWWITFPIFMIIMREIIISSLREWMANFLKKEYFFVSKLAKYKTAFQMISLFGLLWHPNIQIEFFAIILLYLATFLTFLTMFQYFSIIWKFFD